MQGVGAVGGVLDVAAEVQAPAVAEVAGDRQRHVGVAVLDGKLPQGEAVVPGGQDDVLLQAPAEEVPIGGVVGGGALADARAPAFPAGLAARPAPRALAVRVFRPGGRGQR